MKGKLKERGREIKNIGRERRREGRQEKERGNTIPQIVVWLVFGEDTYQNAQGVRNNFVDSTYLPSLSAH